MPPHAADRQESQPRQAPRRSTKPAVPTAATAAGAGENAPAGVLHAGHRSQDGQESRVHLDLTSSATDHDQEIDRLLALRVRRADIAQTGTESWIVLADPKETKFCIVRPKETLIG